MRHVAITGLHGYRERRRDERQQRNLIKRDKLHLLWHPHTLLLEGEQRTTRDEIIAGKDRGRRVRKCQKLVRTLCPVSWLSRSSRAQPFQYEESIGKSGLLKRHIE